MRFKSVFELGLLLFAISENAFGQSSLPWLKHEEPKGPQTEEVRESQLPLARVRIEGSGEVWVGQAVPLNVEVIVPTWFTGAPKFPDLDVPNAMTLSPEAAVNFVVQAGGKAFSAQGRRYLIFPQAKGKYTVPSVKVEVTFALPNGNPTPPKVLASPPAQFEARIPPGAEGAKYFLTTDRLQISQSFDRKPDGLKVGDSVTRTVTMTAQNTVGISLPPLNFEAPEGVRLYPGMPKVTETAERGKIEATRTESVAYVLEREGDYRLPEITVLWWNPRTKTMNRATLPSLELKVQASSAYNPEVFASSQTEEAPPGTAEGGPRRRLVAALPWVLPLLAAILLFLILRRVLDWKGLSLGAYFTQKRRRRADAEITYFQRFRRASLANDAIGTLRELMSWLDRTNTRPAAPTLEQFARESGLPELLKGGEALNGFLFSRPGKAGSLELQSEWSGRSFYQAVARARKEQIRRSKRHAPEEHRLLSLNPGKE